ncbi:SPP1 family predicted phage head-tail adaptor [Herbaspirillum sp. 1130]|nr:SPP1 family predicted phage head-tail adaptor [Herbaspirillum sp. 1130]
MFTRGMRHLVQIQYSTSGRGSDGDNVTTWVRLADVYAEQQDLSGRLLETAQARFAEAEVSFRIRFRNGITPDMRIRHQGRFYRIGAVLDRTGRRLELYLICTGGLLDGQDGG